MDTRLLRPWDFLGKNTGVGCRFLLQGTSRPRDQTQVSHIVDRRFPSEPPLDLSQNAKKRYIKGTLKTLTRSSHVTPCGLEHNTRKHTSKTTFDSVFNPSFHMEFFLSVLNFAVKTFIYTEKYIEMIVQSISIYTVYLDPSVVPFGYTYFVFPLQTHVCVLSHISYVSLFANLWIVA